MGIKSIKHKGLKSFFTNGDRSKLPSEQLAKITRVLIVIDGLEKVPDDLDRLSHLKPHKLKGNYADYWAITITGNYRIMFKFDSESKQAYDLDYKDYH